MNSCHRRLWAQHINGRGSIRPAKASNWYRVWLVWGRRDFNVWEYRDVGIWERRLWNVWGHEHGGRDYWWGYLWCSTIN